MFPDPVPTVLSRRVLIIMGFTQGRIALRETAAHPFHPTTQQKRIRGSEAIAACLAEINGKKSDIPLAMRVSDRIQYGRRSNPTPWS